MSERSPTYRATPRAILPVAELPPDRPRGGGRPYRRGAEAERSLLKQFWQDGCLAIRSAGSGGPFDLAIVLPNGGRLLQCKLCGAGPTDGQIARWLDALPAVPSGWSAELWVKVTGAGWAVYGDGAASAGRAGERAARVRGNVEKGATE